MHCRPGGGVLQHPRDTLTGTPPRYEAHAGPGAKGKANGGPLGSCPQVHVPYPPGVVALLADPREVTLAGPHNFQQKVPAKGHEKGGSKPLKGQKEKAKLPPTQ